MNMDNPFAKPNEKVRININFRNVAPHFAVIAETFQLAIRLILCFCFGLLSDTFVDG